MSITLNTVVFNNDIALNSNKYQYLATDHTFEAVNKLTLARTDPKPTSTFRGVARAEAKRTQTVTLDDSTEAEAIVTVTCSLPVGMAAADIDAIRDDMGDFLLATECDELFTNQTINT